MKRLNYVKLTEHRRNGPPLRWEGWVYAKRSEAIGHAFRIALQEFAERNPEDSQGWSAVLR